MAAMPSGEELLAIIEMIHREREIDKETLFRSLESAILTAARKKFGHAENLTVRIDRETGAIIAREDGKEIDPIQLGRIAAQTAKQVFIQKMREAESDIVYHEYEHKVGKLALGTVKRYEAGTMIVDLGRAEAVIPKSQQVRSEHYHPGDRIRAYVMDVEKTGSRVKITLSRAHPMLVFCLFEVEVPEVAEGVVEILRLAREPGYRTKMLVRSLDPKVDPVGACVGVRGSRIVGIREELGGEKIDIIPWSDNLAELVQQALKPAEVRRVEFDAETGRATVDVDEEYLSLAIGRKGLNARLAARLCEVPIRIVTSQAETAEPRLEYEVEEGPDVEEEEDLHQELEESPPAEPERS